MSAPDVAFPGLGISIQDLDVVAFSLPFFGGTDIMWYGLFVALGLLCGTLIGLYNTRFNGISKELLIDFLIIAFPVGILCTRLYYVLFNLEHYRGRGFFEIISPRGGGMGIYGGILSAFLTLFLFSFYQVHKRKKKPGKEVYTSTIDLMGRMGDVCVFGLLIGQIFGRLGNFTNREAFGRFYDGLFRMQLALDDVLLRSGNVTEDMIQNAEFYSGTSDLVTFVHPTFLYEMMLNIGIFALLWFYRGKRRFYGELLLLYGVLYGLGRFFIENLRTDQLLLWGTEVPVSMVVSAAMTAAALALWVLGRRKNELRVKN